MEAPRRLKAYKNLDPYKTIQIIRGILEKNDIFLIEINMFNKDVDFFSSGLLVDDDSIRDLKIGAYGKGMTVKYSLAASYAEMIERLQNNSLFFRDPLYLKYATAKFLDSDCISASFKKRLEDENLVLKFVFGPDEKYISVENLLNEPGDVMARLMNEKDKSRLSSYFRDDLNKTHLVCVPFYHINSGAVKYLPIELIRKICTTSGMCAGNTGAEAVIHGICEIFERYAIRRLYMDEIIPPTIPDDYFRDTEILRKVTLLKQKHNMSVTIKDCSLGLDLPVIGVILIKQDTSEYTFHLASDPSPITALERCFTEIYQGSPRFANKYLDLTRDLFTLKDTDGNPTGQMKRNYYETSFLGRGVWPNHIFSANADYEFKGFKHPTSISDEDDLNYLLERIDGLGLELYVRDVSFLGFPSFHVYIPSMSELDFTPFGNKDLGIYETLFDLQATLCNVKGSGDGDIEKLAFAMEDYYKAELPKPISGRQIFLPNHNESLNTIEPELLLCMLFYRIGNYMKAFEYMKLFLSETKDNERKEKMYFYAVRDYLKFKADNASDSLIFARLASIYGEEKINEILSDLADPKQVFKYYSWPACFHCPECEIKSDCRYFDVLKYVKRLENVYEDNSIDQNHLSKLFSAYAKNKKESCLI